MKFPGPSRREFLKNSVIAGGAATLQNFVPASVAYAHAASAQGVPGKASDGAMKGVAPAGGETTRTFLTATLEWEYGIREKAVVNGASVSYWNYVGVRLKVSTNQDMNHPVVNVRFPDDVTIWRIPVLPNQTYYWEVIPCTEDGEQPESAFRAGFTSGAPIIDETANDNARYKNPRRGAHFRHMKPVRFAAAEPLSPWYEVKSYLAAPPPRFEDIKDKLPVPVIDSEPLIDLYWYCWKTLINVWSFAPSARDHQAVANLVGARTWGGLGKHRGLGHLLHAALCPLRTQSISLRRVVG